MYLQIIYFISTAIEREEQKTVQMIKAAAKKNEMESCKVLAKGMVQ